VGLRELAKEILLGFGYQVLEASHGKEALSLWQTADRKPDLLFTDMMMPEGITGKELAGILRTNTPALRVIYTSGYSPELFGGDLDLSDHSIFLAKPYNSHSLAKVVRDCLDNQPPVA
jgi:CheY-like chemotaxis protein